MLIRSSCVRFCTFIPSWPHRLCRETHHPSRIELPKSSWGSFCSVMGIQSHHPGPVMLWLIWGSCHKRKELKTLTGRSSTCFLAKKMTGASVTLWIGMKFWTLNAVSAKTMQSRWRYTSMQRLLMVSAGILRSTLVSSDLKIRELPVIWILCCKHSSLLIR